jgi:hypothetical protein
MKITQKWMREVGACQVARVALRENRPMSDPFEILDKAMEISRFDWANWMITRLMNKRQQVEYAVFAAELVINIYEDKNPSDDRPRKAIEAAKAYLKSPSKSTKKKAYAAADAAAAYAYDAAAAAAAAAYAAYAYAAADAAYAAAAADAAYAAYAAAAYAAYAAADADAAAAAAADAAYAAARKDIQKQIIEYGKTLLK